MSGAQTVERSLPVTIIGTRLTISDSRHSCPILTRVGLSAKFMSVPTTIWLFTVICVFSAQSKDTVRFASAHNIWQWNSKPYILNPKPNDTHKHSKRTQYHKPCSLIKTNLMGLMCHYIKKLILIRGTLHQSLRACDCWNLKSLIGGEGQDCPTSLNIRAWGPKTPRKCKWMKHLHGVLHGMECFMVYQILCQAHLKVVGLNTKPGEHGTSKSRNTSLIIIYCVKVPHE